LQYDLDRAVFDLRREHPFRSHRDTGIGEYSRAHSLGSTDARATLQRDRDLHVIALKVPVFAPPRGRKSRLRAQRVRWAWWVHEPVQNRSGFQQLPGARSRCVGLSSNIDPLLYEVDVAIVEHNVNFEIRMSPEKFW
jgi:hypothetical protein